MTTGEELRQLRIIHLSLCIGCLLLLVVLGFLSVQGQVPSAPEWAPALHLLGPVSLGLLVVSFALFRKKFILLGTTPSPAGDLRAALILHWALIELPCLLNALIFHLTGSLAALGCAGLALMVLVLRHPSPARVQRWSTGQL